MTTKGEHPTYQRALRAIGRYFDQLEYRHVLVSEVEDGFVARGFHGRRAILAADGLALPLGDVLALIAGHERGAGQERGAGLRVGEAGMPPLCPTGYQDYFRALGHVLDAAGAANVCLVEMGGGFLVSYTARGKRGPERSQMVFDPPRIEALLTEGHRRRGWPARTA